MSSQLVFIPFQSHVWESAVVYLAARRGDVIAVADAMNRAVGAQFDL